MSQPVRLLRIVRRAAWVAVAVSLLLVGGAWLLRDPAPAPAPAAIAIGGPFALTDHLGRAVSDQDYRGAYMLIYFGYINCPDICVPALDNMSAALDALGTAGDAIQPIFITVDPDNDTPDVIARHVKAIHPGMIGLTGTKAELRAAAKAYRVSVKLLTKPGDKAPIYAHGSYIFLMKPDGKFAALYPPVHGPEAIAASVRRHIQ